MGAAVVAGLLAVVGGSAGATATTATGLGLGPTSASAAPALFVPTSGTSPSPSPSPVVPAGAPRVLIVGDSTTVHMRAAFEIALAARGLAATIDARSGRTTREGRAVLALYPLADFDYVVVLLGANGKRANALRDMTALRRMGVDTMATVQAPERATVNRAVRAVFGAERITWAGHADRLGITTTDGKHYTRAAYDERARYLAGEIAERVA